MNLDNIYTYFEMLTMSKYITHTNIIILNLSLYSLLKVLTILNLFKS